MARGWLWRQALWFRCAVVLLHRWATGVRRGSVRLAPVPRPAFSHGLPGSLRRGVGPGLAEGEAVRGPAPRGSR